MLEYPENWTAYPSARGYGVTIAARGGLVSTSDGRRNVVNGLVVNHYVPFDGAVGARYRDPLGSLFGRTPLEEATSDLVRQVINAQPYLRVVAGSARRLTISGATSFSVRLTGPSRVTGEGETMTVVTRLLPDDHVIYMIHVARPGTSPGLRRMPIAWCAASRSMARSPTDDGGDVEAAHGDATPSNVYPCQVSLRDLVIVR